MTLPIGQRAGLTITTRPNNAIGSRGGAFSAPLFFTIKRVSIGFVLIDLCHCSVT